MRWKQQNGPARRSRRWTSRIKRALTRFSLRDQRFRRIVLNHLFSEHMARQTLCLVKFDDHEIFVDPRDDKIAFTLLSGRAWQRGDLEAAMALASTHNRLPRGGVFVDVGANIGAMTLYAMLSGQFSHALAIEPDAHNRSILERNIATNGLSEKVTIAATAASFASGELPLYRDEKNRGAHSLEEGFVMTPSTTHVVSVDRLDQIVKDNGISTSDVSFLKIDVEGHEQSVLHGASRILSNTPALMLEATFDNSTSAAGLNDYHAITKHLQGGYLTCAQIDDRQPGTNLPVSHKLDEFMPSEIQHELLFF